MLNRILGFLGWFGSLLVFVAVGVWIVRPDLDTLRRTLAFAGLANILLYGAGHWRQVLRSFERKQTRYGLFAGTGVILALAILSGLNWMLSRQNHRWDLTAAQQYSLSDQTRQVLETLPAPVRILVFARQLDFPPYEDRLGQYAYESDQVSVDYIDADRQPMLARQYEIETYGTIVFEHQERIERVSSLAEQDLTNALISVVEGEERKVYFLEGHGEKSHTGADEGGYSTVTDALGFDNFGVETLILAQRGSVPEDATVVVTAGPQTDFLPDELTALDQYLEGGGKLLVMLDPPIDTGTPTPEGLVELLANWGISIGDDVVVDASGMGQFLGADASVPIAANYPIHPITDRFNLLTAYPLARSVAPISPSPEGRVAQSFIETGSQSWAEMDVAGLTGGAEVLLDEEAGDLPGPIAIGAAVSVAVDGTDAEAAEAIDGPEADAPASPEARLAVIGDSDFASNAVVGVSGNRDMFLNTVNWLARQENLIAIRARDPEDRRLTLTADQQRGILVLSLLLIPAATAGAGFYTWWRRR